MISNLSPNVHYINNKLFDTYKDIDIPTAEFLIHDYNIYEININDTLMNNGLLDEFNWLFKQKNAISYTMPVNVSGIVDNKDIGSYRISTHNPQLAIFLTRLINSFSLDINQNKNTFLKVADYFRFMRYHKNGEHFPHYDSDYWLNNDHYTGYSLVMYLNDCHDGDLVFCHDHRPDLTERREKNDIFLLDWDRQCHNEEIYLKIRPEAGKIVLFPHSLCHSVLPFTGESRNIIRGDLIFQC